MPLPSGHRFEPEGGDAVASPDGTISGSSPCGLAQNPDQFLDGFHLANSQESDIG